MIIKFKVPGQLQSKARPRFTKGGRVYTPKNTREYESKVRRAYKSAANGKRFVNEPLSVNIIAYLKRAKTNKREFATTKPDIDNIVKAVLDGLNGVAFKDDKQVVNLTVCKLYCDSTNDMPFTAVELTDGKE